MIKIRKIKTKIEFAGMGRMNRGTKKLTLQQSNGN